MTEYTGFDKIYRDIVMDIIETARIKILPWFGQNTPMAALLLLVLFKVSTLRSPSGSVAKFSKPIILLHF
ncbi:Uncharacterised protein [Enterococcus malodoratus]|uniref:hypothetical protein n=1 Tax=Enterococcus malodoratus TaxID=71451 RepID=UPI000D92AD7C|nr:hypothetical protein [Enterococcus malodoratus]SPX03947.1 Uncharacterised protein [Enterococcus malodoratus]